MVVICKWIGCDLIKQFDKLQYQKGVLDKEYHSAVHEISVHGISGINSTHPSHNLLRASAAPKTDQQPRSSV